MADLSTAPPCTEVKEALMTLVKLFKANSKDGKFVEGELTKKMEEKKKCPKVQAKMAECKAKLKEGVNCEDQCDFAKFCWFMTLQMEEMREGCEQKCS